MTPEERESLRKIRAILKRGTAEPMPGDVVAIKHKCRNSQGQGGWLTKGNCCLPDMVKSAVVKSSVRHHPIAKTQTHSISIRGFPGTWLVQRRCISHVIKYTTKRVEVSNDE